MGESSSLDSLQPVVAGSRSVEQEGAKPDLAYGIRMNNAGPSLQGWAAIVQKRRTFRTPKDVRAFYTR